MKICSRCKEPKDITRFGKATDKGRPYTRGVCLDCYAAAARADYLVNGEKRRKRNAVWQANNREYQANYDRFAKYGLDKEGFQKILLAQEGRCKICQFQFQVGQGQQFSPHVDHCHTTGKIRGLLCVGCNAGLGNFQESPDRMLSAIRYLQNS